MYHVTQVKRKLKDRLVEHLPTRLAAADAMVGDGIATPVPYEVHTTDVSYLGGYPSLELIVTDSTPKNDSYAQIYRHRIVIGVSVGGDNEERLSIQLERYMWCLRQLIRDASLPQLWEGSAPMETGGEQYTPLQQRPDTAEEPYVRGAFIEVFVTTVE